MFEAGFRALHVGTDKTTDFFRNALNMGGSHRGLMKVDGSKPSHRHTVELLSRTAENGGCQLQVFFLG